jgi:hypothetical protein
MKILNEFGRFLKYKFHAIGPKQQKKRSSVGNKSMIMGREFFYRKDKEKKQMNLFFISIKETETELFLGNFHLDQPTYVC